MKKQSNHTTTTSNLWQKNWDMTYLPGNIICLEPSLLALIRLRVALMHGCQLCIDTSVQALKALGESTPRIEQLKSWRQNPLYDQSEQAAMALTEALTALPSGPVPSQVVLQARNHFNEAEIVQVVLNVLAANDWNDEFVHRPAAISQRRRCRDSHDEAS